MCLGGQVEKKWETNLALCSENGIRTGVTEVSVDIKTHVAEELLQ